MKPEINKEILHEDECSSSCDCTCKNTQHHAHHHDDCTESSTHSHCCCCHEDDEEEEEEETSLKKIILSAVLFAMALFLEHLPIFAENAPFIEGLHINYIIIKGLYAALYLASYLLVGKNVIQGAIKNLRKGNLFGEQFLMSVASIGAIFVGEYMEAVAVMLFYSVGEFFQDYAVDKSRDSIQALMDIRPDKATVLRNGKTEVVSPESVNIGELIQIKPGERIPLDGTIESGESFADTSALTGESVPRKISSGDTVLAGFINTTGVITVKVEKTFGDSTATRILKLTQKASAVKAKSEKFITRFAKVYTPIVCICAVAVALIPPIVLKVVNPELLTRYGFSTWIYRALMFLVVSCPCALVISIPMTFFSGIGAASAAGILVKGSNFIEKLAKATTIVFDKTGTLTQGVFNVSKIIPANGTDETQLLSLAAHAEYYSQHPISTSIKLAHSEASNGECCSKVLRENAQEIAGHGIKINLDGKTVLVGSSKLMEKEKISDFCPYTEKTQGTVIYVALEGVYKGCIIISDKTKPEAAQTLKELKKLGIHKTAMLTGDSEETALAVAEEIGIDDVYAQLLPEDKVSRITELKQKSANESIAFVGDGINDAPVLACADVGIAMGALGSDAAIEAADIVIMDDNLSRLKAGIKIARKTTAIVKENLIFSIGVKVAIMILGAAGIANMWVAVFGDVGVCFLAVLNAMRALSVRKDTK